MKTPVVYFSRKGYVKKIAEEKAKECGGDILELKTSERTKGWLGFWWCGRFAMHRWEMPLEKYATDVSEYDKLIICSPIWVFDICAPVRSFIMCENGKIKSADYVLVHYSFPMKYTRTAALMDDILGIKHNALTSICCVFGKTLRKSSSIG